MHFDTFCSIFTHVFITKVKVKMTPNVESALCNELKSIPTKFHAVLKSNSVGTVTTFIFAPGAAETEPWGHAP